MKRVVLWVITVALLAGCPRRGTVADAGGSGGGGGGAADAGSQTCRPCLTGAECETGGACVQYSGDSFCARSCAATAECATLEDCALATDFGGLQVQVCLPRSGSCAVDAGCGVCGPGTSCDLPSGSCVEGFDAGPADAGACGTRVPPETPACCHSCVAGVGSCQANGCYGGWWCDTASASNCSCRPPPTSCSGNGDDAGVFDAGVFDAGVPGDGGLIGPNGGFVDRLFFAVVGDTRPANPDETATYPTAIITKIYADLAAMSPPPQFVVTTGDYQFSSPYGVQAAIQLGYYVTARNQYPGTVFAAMGNHECSGATASNCVGAFTGRNNYDAFVSALVTPLGKSTPYYAVPVQTSLGSVKFLVAACNAWDANQKAWLAGELAQSTTFTVIVRHEPLAAFAPCTDEMNAMLQASTYDLLLVGHTHSFFRIGKQLVVGMGGAPIGGNTPFGYITVEQLATGGWHVIQYDSTTSMPVQIFDVP